VKKKSPKKAPAIPAPHHEEQAFLDAILAQPDDDTPRLVFADWLDENGTGDAGARAALIRAQCQMERLAPRTREYIAQELQAEAVLKKHAARWTQPLADAEIGNSWRFRRGFLDELTLSARDFVRVAKKLFQLAPTIRTIRFPAASNELTELAGSAYLARLNRVNLQRMCGCGGCPIDVELRNLFASPHAANITELNLAEDRMDAAGVEALVNSAHITQLTSLDLSDNPIGVEGVAAIRKSKNLAGLVSLNLCSAGLRTTGTRALAAATNLPMLTHLALAGNGIGPMSLRSLVVAPFATQLMSLDLSTNQLGDAGGKVLLNAEKLAGLKSLNLRSNKIGTATQASLRERFREVVIL